MIKRLRGIFRSLKRGRRHSHPRTVRKSHSKRTRRTVTRKTSSPYKSRSRSRRLKGG